MKVFLSSTLGDLKFERRAVAQALQEAGFEVVRMEDIKIKYREFLDEIIKLAEKDNFKDPYEWIEKQAEKDGLHPFDLISRKIRKEEIYNPLQWSTNRAVECDAVVVLLGERCGSLPGDSSWDYDSFVQHEIRAARTAGKTVLAYKLNRPFPDDAKLLMSSNEKDALRKSRAIRDTNSTVLMLPDIWKRQMTAGLRVNEINSVHQLTVAIVSDLKRASKWIKAKQYLPVPIPVLRRAWDYSAEHLYIVFVGFAWVFALLIILVLLVPLIKILLHHLFSW